VAFDRGCDSVRARAAYFVRRFSTTGTRPRCRSRQWKRGAARVSASPRVPVRPAALSQECSVVSISRMLLATRTWLRIQRRRCERGRSKGAKVPLWTSVGDASRAAPSNADDEHDGAHRGLRRTSSGWTAGVPVRCAVRRGPITPYDDEQLRRPPDARQRSCAHQSRWDR
jgi:hypothetical protein